MTLNGKQDGFTLDDFRACVKNASMKRGRAEEIVKDVTNIVDRWRNFADELHVNPVQRDKIQTALRLDFPK